MYTMNVHIFFYNNDMILKPLKKFYDLCVLFSGCPVEEVIRCLGYKNRSAYYAAKANVSVLDFRKLSLLIENKVLTVDQVTRIFRVTLKGYIASKSGNKNTE